MNRSKVVASVACLFAVAVMLAACGSDPVPPAALATIAVPVANGTPINPTTPIVVDATGGTLTTVTVTNADGKQVTSQAAAGGKQWTTTEDLGYGHTYTVKATAVNADKVPTVKTFTVDTIAPSSTAYANVVPAPELVADVGIGIGQPMVVQFTAPVTNKAEVLKHLVVKTTPSQPGAWYWMDDQHVHYRGPNYWKPGTKIHLEADVYGVDLGDGVYGAEDTKVDYTVHDSWVAKADGATELLTVFHNGQQVKQMPMSLGEPDHPSHTGPHVISEKAAVTIMDSCTYGVCQGDPGYYRETVYNDLRISNDGEFVHSAPWSVGQQGAANVSHGCVNLSPADSKWMFDTFGIGDVVEITNSGGPPLPVWDIYGDWELSWAQWQAGGAQ
ncbi:lipoprotein-anchoring transpeptidase ErfK/SrfK [Gordonia hydrophobica]|nr:lipoprotein-anchoring transpeptidase ErfK/SrfK [Gordonia hydrophobica]